MSPRVVKTPLPHASGVVEPRIVESGGGNGGEGGLFSGEEVVEISGVADVAG